mmetsp:Transcript_17587/g.45322  ORF Transcript_17587/g.45322 Transcript_17587/m.45322 type:complete len:257 (+) Transcript_17587:873-1643(+)
MDAAPRGDEAKLRGAIERARASRDDAQGNHEAARGLPHRQVGVRRGGGAPEGVLPRLARLRGEGEEAEGDRWQRPHRDRPVGGRQGQGHRACRAPVLAHDHAEGAVRAAEGERRGEAAASSPGAAGCHAAGARPQDAGSAAGHRETAPRQPQEHRHCAGQVAEGHREGRRHSSHASMGPVEQEAGGIRSAYLERRDAAETFPRRRLPGAQAHVLHALEVGVPELLAESQAYGNRPGARAPGGDARRPAAAERGSAA